MQIEAEDGPCLRSSDPSWCTINALVQIRLSGKGRNKNLETWFVQVYYHTYTMAKNETPEEIKRSFLHAIQKLWPIAMGSISLRKSPCIRENCSACASGIGHSSYALSGYRGKRRFSVYVPDELAPDIQKAIENGRQVQDLMKEAGLRYLQARKRKRREAAVRKER